MNTLASMPRTFKELVSAPPIGYSISERVIDPAVYVSRTSGKIIAAFGGIKKQSGTSRFLGSPSLEHDWVADGTVLRPLPTDSPFIFLSWLGKEKADDLSFSKAIQLMRSPPDGFTANFSDELFNPANISAAGLPKSLLIPGLEAKLHPYQAQGVRWMSETISRTGGLILADEMGLGKTLQIIALLLMDPPEAVSPALIICPTSLIANWEREFEKFAPGLSISIHRGPDRPGTFRGLQTTQIVISTYETIVNDIAIFSAFRWSWVICDEAQSIKNPQSDRRRAISTIPRRNTIPMTGTPVENTLLDLFSLADFAVPGVLGSRQDFEKEFPDTPEAGRALGCLIDPIILKRRVRDVAADLPERIDIDLPIVLDEKLARHYEEVRQKVLSEHPVAGSLVATLQLQLLSAHPWLRVPGQLLLAGHRSEESNPDPEWSDAEIQANDFPLITPKMEAAIRIIREAFYPDGFPSNRRLRGQHLSCRKVLVFSQYNRVGDLIRQACNEFGEVFWGAINGSTRQEDRQKIVDEFSSHDGPACLVLNPRAAGAGLNITAATIVVHFTPVWNPAIEAQASARAHRLGQKEPVTVYRLFYKDTVEEIMIERSAWKTSLANETIPISARDRSDLRRAINITPRSK